jgi:hypothetical protein
LTVTSQEIRTESTSSRWESPVRCSLSGSQARRRGHTEGQSEFAYSFAQIENYGKITRAWCVLKKWNRVPFSDAGDSGVPVVAPTGGLVGFVFAGCGGRPMDLKGHDELGHVYVSYIESARMVFERITAAFGGQVELDAPDLKSTPNILFHVPPQDEDSK